MRRIFCDDCGHDLDIHDTEQHTSYAYCADWGCDCFVKVSWRGVPGSDRGGSLDGCPSLPGCEVPGNPHHTRR